MNVEVKSSRKLWKTAQDKLYPLEDRAACLIELVRRYRAGRKVF